MKKFLFLIFATFCNIAIYAATKDNLLYSIDFSNSESITTTSSYTSNVTFTDNNYSWFVSSYRYTSSAFQLGCSTSSTSTYALDAADLADINSAWQASDESYESVTQVFALQLSTAVEKAKTLSFEWTTVSGGAMVAFLFVDTDGTYSLAATEIASQSSSGTISYSLDAETTVNRIALVVRGGSSLSSTATKRNITLGEFSIYGEPIVVTTAPTPEFLYGNTYPFWPGASETISIDEDYSDAQLHYSIDNGDEVVSSEYSVTLPITEACNISAYSSIDDINSETVSKAYEIFDLNEDFSDWSGNFPDSWTGSIAKSNISQLDGGGISLSQTTTSAKRLYTETFILKEGTYTFSADCQFLAEGSQTLTLEYQLPSVSSSYKSDATTAISATSTETQSVSYTFTIDEQSIILLSICLSKKSASGDDDWTVYVNNLSFAEQSTGSNTSIYESVIEMKDFVSVQGSKVVVNSAVDETITVYDLLGRVVSTTVAKSEITTLDTLPTKQILIVRAGNSTTKISLR